MKKPSQQWLLSSIFVNVFGRELDAGSLDDRVMLQKTVFFMHEFGVTCGDYNFSWDHYGPFSPDLSDDMKKKVEDDTPVRFSAKAEQVMEKLREIFNTKSEYLQRYWVEAIASLYYLKKYMYPTHTEEEIIEKLENMKRDSLGNDVENHRAMESLNKLFAA